MIAIPLILFSKVKYHMTSFLKSPRRRLTLTTMLYLVFFTIFSLPVITDWTKLITRSTVTNDRVLNSIAMNGISSSTCGILTMLDRELDGSKFYGSMSESEVLERLSNYSSTTWHQRTTVGVGSKADRFHSLQSVPKSQTFPEKINLVIIIEESLSALFTGHLGGKNLTPELDKLVMEGLYCSRMYANGDRTVRALEAVTCGLLPTAGRSILKQKKIPDQFFSLGRVLKNEGYVTEFIYGGDKNFDYMWRFFTAIGFDHVYDEANNTKQDVFHGPWGICDSDLFERACDIFDSHKENPFASLILTTSIHDPFTYPENIGPVSGNPATPENAVRYADKALGNFFARAKKSEWYKNTIFVFVSDHNLRVSGEGLIPVEAFHIPSFIIGPGVPVKEHKEICHQIDLVPTILNLLDVRTNVPLMGSDLLSVPEDPRATNRAFIATGYTAALFNNKSMVVLNPGSPPEYYVKDGSSFTPSKTLNTELAKDCQAFALSTNVLFNSPVYTVK
jgi:phosphoglycerol transferase MdoB-like AlkP superfamily enzyme